MIFKFITYLFLLFVTSAFAESGEYQLYLCQNNVKASIKCELCQKSEGVSFTFKVQPLNNTVLRKTYKNNEAVNDTSYNNCKVVDAKNWQCEDTAISSYTMSNGSYRSLLVGNGGYVLATCAKKKSFFD